MNARGNSFACGLTQVGGITNSGSASGEPLNHVPGIWDGIVWNDPHQSV